MTPSGWRTVTLRDVASDISYGFTASASDTANGPKMLRITDIQDNRVDWQSVPRCECDAPEKYLLSAGDIVIARTGATTGKSFLLGEVPEASVFASYLIRVQPGPSVIPAYLARYMQSPTYWAQITTVSKGTAQPGANASILGGLELPLAPIDEQRRIVAKLEALQSRSRRAREALDAVAPLLEKLRQSILAAAFRGDLTADWRAQNPDAEPLDILESGNLADSGNKHLWGSGRTADGVDPAWGSIPASWRWVRVRDLNHDSSAAVQIGPMSMKSNEFIDEGTRVLNVGCVQRGRIDISKADHLPPKRAEDFERYRLEPHDVLFTRSGTVGRCAILPPEFGGSLMTFHLLRVRPSPERCAAAFLMFAFQGCHAVSAQIEASSVGATRAGFNTRLLADMWIPLPPREEQTELLSRVVQMVKRLDALQAQLDDIEQKVTAADAALLAKAFRGELVPQDPNDEPADATASPLTPTAKAPKASGAKGRKGAELRGARQEEA